METDNEADKRPVASLPIPETAAASDWTLLAAAAGIVASLVLVWRHRRRARQR
ncbi:hypothetical protein [Luedemannella flava]